MCGCLMTLDLSCNINAVVKIVVYVILPNEGIGLIFFRCLNESLMLLLPVS